MAPPNLKQMRVASVLCLSGHKDIFDCLGFGCAESLSLDFLSEDKELKRLVDSLRKKYQFNSIVRPLREVI